MSSEYDIRLILGANVPNNQKKARVDLVDMVDMVDMVDLVDSLLPFN